MTFKTKIFINHSVMCTFGKVLSLLINTKIVLISLAPRTFYNAKLVAHTRADYRISRETYSKCLMTILKNIRNV